MQASNKTFNPRLIITDHFGKIRNQIDVMTETLIHERRHSADQSFLADINAIRSEQLVKIDEIEQENLTKWLNFDQEEFEQHWSGLIDDTSIDYDQKVDKMKEDLLQSDCVLVEEDSLVAPRSSLWIMPFFVNETNRNISK